ncbi:MAG: hypothetical protein KQH57_11855 [Actinomycetales bacterium]|nr:hypothetical protein [Actinomycetales bacterium]
MRRRIAAIVLVIASTLLAGCVNQTPDPTTQPSTSSPQPSTPESSEPSATPSTPSEEESAALAAEDVVRAYNRATVDCLADPVSSEPTCFDGVAIGTELTNLRNLLASAQQMQTRATGSIEVVSVDLVSVSLDIDLKASPPVVPEVVLVVCRDVSGYDIVDKDGNSIVSPDRVERRVIEFHVLNYDYPDPTTWRVGFYVAPDEVTTC